MDEVWSKVRMVTCSTHVWCSSGTSSSVVERSIADICLLFLQVRLSYFVLTLLILFLLVVASVAPPMLPVSGSNGFYYLLSKVLVRGHACVL